jgi:hypothetical protein
VDERWLRGILACGLSVEAGVIRHVLGEQGLRCRSVPSGRALAAWTCATSRGTIAVVVSGRGLAAARRSAGFWVSRSPTVIVVGAAAATTAQPGPPTVALDGDEQLAAAVESAARRLGITVAAGRVATVSVAPITEAALISLAGAGYAAVDGESDGWRDAAADLGAVMVSCRGLLDHSDNTLAALPPMDRAEHSPWTAPLRALSPARRAAHQRADEAISAAADTAARCAISALIGG